MNSVTGTDGPQDGLHEDFGSLGGRHVDCHLRKEVDQPTLEQILVLVGILVEIHVEPGPAPTLGAEELAPFPVKIII